MYKYVIYVISLLLVRANADSCLTPLGASSECVSLYDCASLVSVFSQIPIPSNVTHFLRQSHCGFDGTTPKVCCGPLPSNLTQNGSQKITTKTSAGLVEPADPVDSYPEPRPKCGKDTSANRIHGGTATELGEFPWIALLAYRTPAGYSLYLCGGALINRRYVLTAAHCLTLRLQQTVGKLTSVRLGEHDTENSLDCNEDECADPPQEILVQSFHPHYRYSESNRNRADDIGLVRLLQRAIYSDFVQPICLVNTENSRYDVGNIVYIAGWGRTESGSPSPIKLKVDIPIYEKRICSVKYSQNFSVHLTEKQLCAGGELNKDSCGGDSGGPVMRILPGDIWEAIAVISFGYSCGVEGWPAVYTSVADYLDWIQAKMIETNV